MAAGPIAIHRSGNIDGAYRSALFTYYRYGILKLMQKIVVWF
jgi:hypothetical protein